MKLLERYKRYKHFKKFMAVANERNQNGGCPVVALGVIEHLNYHTAYLTCVNYGLDEDIGGMPQQNIWLMLGAHHWKTDMVWCVFTNTITTKDAIKKCGEGLHVLMYETHIAVVIDGILYDTCKIDNVKSIHTLY